MLLVFSLILTTLFIIKSDEPIDAYTLHSSEGCCTISVVVTSSTEYDTIYTIVYTDNTTGEEHTEVETREVDAVYMINLFQEWCYEHHNKDN